MENLLDEVVSTPIFTHHYTDSEISCSVIEPVIYSNQNLDSLIIIKLNSLKIIDISTKKDLASHTYESNITCIEKIQNSNLFFVATNRNIFLIEISGLSSLFKISVAKTYDIPTLCEIEAEYYIQSK